MYKLNYRPNHFEFAQTIVVLIHIFLFEYGKKKLNNNKLNKDVKINIVSRNRSCTETGEGNNIWN